MIICFRDVELLESLKNKPVSSLMSLFLAQCSSSLNVFHTAKFLQEIVSVTKF